MWLPGTRSTKRYGPAHTGFKPNLSPAVSAAFGDTIIPAAMTNRPNSGPGIGMENVSLTVRSSMTSTLVIGANAATHVDPRRFLLRSIVYFTAAALNGSPSWNFTPGRSFSSNSLASSDQDHSVASFGS